MKLLLDISAERANSLPEGAAELLCGQLITPLTGYTRWAETFAIDNGAFTEFREDRFKAILERERAARKKCLWVTVPDIVGSAHRTLELWEHRYDFVPLGWRLAFVCQDGMQAARIPWKELDAVFIGGTTEFKCGQDVEAICKTAHILKKPIHIGRINTVERWNHFEKLGADTCDGSGFARFDWMLQRLVNRNDAPLFS